MKKLYEKIEKDDGSISFVPATTVQDNDVIVQDNQLLNACSKRIEQALRIFLKMKSEKLNFNDAAKEVALSLALKPSTIKDIVTRQLDMNTKDFEILINDFIAGKNLNFKKVLLSNIVNVKADTEAIDFFCK